MLSCDLLRDSITLYEGGESLKVLPCMKLMISPVDLLPYLSSLAPPQVER